MNTVANKLMKLVQTKSDIRQALLDKGFNVPDTMPFSGYADLIRRFPCNAKDFPDIPGMIARWSAKGLTNEDMSTNPVWKDLTGNGYDLQMKNFGWAGMSGVNGYVENFNYFRTGGIPVEQLTVDKQNSSLIKISVLVPGINNSIYIPKDRYQFGKSYYLRVSSEGYNEGDLSFLLYATAASTATSIRIPLSPNGITEIPAVQEDDYQAAYIIVGEKIGSLTIEQLPLYPDAIVFDGVDDYGICENFPILTKEKGYTVVALRQWMETTNKVSGVVSNALTWFTDGAFVLEYRNINSGYENTPVSFGRINPNAPLTKSAFTYQTSLEYNGVKINTGTYKGVSQLMVGSVIKKNYPFKGAIWEICILDHDATEEELQKIQDYYKQEYPWLFFDQAWTVVGKTNEDTDRATIANITGNGNNLVLSNFGFAENSGYGLYPYNYMNWISAAGRANFTRTANKIHVTAILKEEYATFIYTQVPSLKQRIKVSGLPEGVNLIIGRSGINFYIISQDGIYNIDVTDETDPPIIGYKINKILESCDITIEQIPEYEGYLVTDGVDDKIQSSNFPMGKDFTVVGEWKLLSVSNYNYAGIVKSNNLYVYNSSTGINIYVCSSSAGNKMEGLKSLKAICSDGRVYDDNWVEYKLKNVGDNIGANSTLDIGTNKKQFYKDCFQEFRNL